jgi:microsomal prostaglandin-E synthase 2
LIINDKQINESSKQISVLYQIARPNEERSIEEVENEKKWRIWADKKLVILLPPNIYRNLNEAIEAFDYVLDKSEFSTPTKYTIKYTGYIYK